jgi:AcrR family transcriptional regulator
MSYHHGDLRSALLQRAEEVIAANGVDGVRLSVLAKDLGVSHGAPARHFKDRNALLAALALRALATLKSYIAEHEGMQHGSPRVRLNTLLKCQVQNTLLRPSHFVLLGHPDLPRIAGRDYDESLAEYNAMLLRCTREAQRDGWRAGEDDEHVAILAYSLAIGLQTLVRYSLKTHDTVVHTELMRASENVANAMKAIDLFIPCADVP